MADVVHLTPESRLFARLEQDRFDPGTLGPFSVAGAVLKAQGAVIRDVRQGPEGYLYLLTDSPQGRLLRVEPAAKTVTP